MQYSNSFRRTCGSVVAAIACLLIAGTGAEAEVEITSVSISPDLTVELAGAVLADEAIGVDDMLGLVVPVSLGSLPGAAAIDGYHQAADGTVYVSFDTTVELPGNELGPVWVGPEDILAFDGGDYAVYMDMEPPVIPDGVRMDAIASISGIDAIVSFDGAIPCTGAGCPVPGVVADEDLVRVLSTGILEVVFDGSVAGVPEALDLDGAHDLGGGRFGLSFDGSGEIDGVVFDDEDVLEYDPSGSGWSLLYDGSAQNAELAAADVEAIALLEPAPLVDGDGDGVGDNGDNCLADANPDQLDSDQDGYGNACDADYNNDGIVGGPDLGIFGAAFGTSVGDPSFDARADHNGDGVIGGPDYGMLGSRWGQEPGPSGLACAGSVPCAPPL